LIAFRPESIVLSDDPDAVNAIPGEVTQCHLGLGPVSVTAALPGYHDLAPGPPAGIAISPAGVDLVADS
jgi:hypothetical protein